jgi:superfamily II DNA helicase RecQ
MIEATVGLVVQYQGYTEPIEEITDEGAVIRIGQATTTIPMGTTVRIDGRLVMLSGPAPAVGSVEAAEAALRTWRGEKARSEGKPAYVFLSDATLVAIAQAQPRTLGGLANIKGIGSGKLTAFGDEILALLDDIR